jgi:hypothetical protein
VDTVSIDYGTPFANDDEDGFTKAIIMEVSSASFVPHG